MRPKHIIAAKKRERRFGKIRRALDERRCRALAQVGFNSYAEYILSPLWLSIRRRVYEAKGRLCVRCGKRADQIHHARYDLATLRGDTLEHLFPVCDDCHRDAEDTPRRVGERPSMLKRANARLGVE